MATPEPRRPVAALVSIIVVLLAGVAGIGLVSRDTVPPPPALPVPIDTEPDGGWSAFPGPTYRLAPGVRVPVREAPAFSLAGDLDRRRIEALKKAVGMRGEFRRRRDWWQLEHGTRVLRIEDGPTRPWFFFTLAGRWCGPEQSADSDVIDQSFCEPKGVSGPGPFAPPPGLPSLPDAERRARALLEDAGFELGGRTNTHGGFDAWDVKCRPAFGGVPILGMPLSVSIGLHGEVVSASGDLATARPLGTYQLTPLEAAIGSMNGTTAPHAAPPRLVKSARLVLAEMPRFGLYARAVVLAPHYEFTLDDGSTVFHLAVAEEHLEPRRPPDPSVEPRIPEPDPYPAP